MPTERGYMGDGYYVTLQHCQFKNEETEKQCDEFLGVNYPSVYCDKHQPKK